MVPEDSSAARMPLPGAPRAVAILFSSVRFIEMSSQNDSALAGENRPFSGKCRVNVRRRVRGEGACYLAPLAGRGPIALAIRVRGYGSRSRLICGESPSPQPSPREGRGEGDDRACRTSRHLRGELALGVALGHLGRGQHLLDLGGLACGIEFLEPLLA